MKKYFIILILSFMLLSSLSNAAMRTREGQITGMTVLSGVCSLLLWPGIGQAVNNDTQDKIVGHALFGLVDIVTRVPVAHVWSGFDALINRRGGYLEGKI